MSVQIKSDEVSKNWTLDSISKIVNARLIHGTINVKYYRNDKPGQTWLKPYPSGLRQKFSSKPPSGNLKIC